MKRFHFSKPKIIIFSVAIVMLAFLISIILLRIAPKNLDSVSAVTKLVGRHYLLPTNETPALATVEDTSKLSSDFFRSAKNGDKLLIYKNAKKVILYRPGIDKLVEVGPVSIAEQTDGTSKK